MQEVDIGLAPDIGSLAFLPKITGNQSLLRELTYTARSFSAAEADKLGLVSKVVPGGRDEVVHEALELAKFIAAKSPIAVTGSKHLITHARDHRCAYCVFIVFPRPNVEAVLPRIFCIQAPGILLPYSPMYVLPLGCSRSQ